LTFGEIMTYLDYNGKRKYSGKFWKSLTPKIPEIRKMITDFKGDGESREELTEDLMALWFTLQKRSRGILKYYPGEYEPDLDTYFRLKNLYKEASKIMWNYIGQERQEQKRQWELNTPEAVKKYLKIYIPTIENLEYIRKVRGAEFFNKEPVLSKVDHDRHSPKDKKRVETELETLWYIVLHIGPKRRVQKSLNPDSIDFLIYKKLKYKYESRHRKMVDYIKEHQELYTEPKHIEN